MTATLDPSFLFKLRPVTEAAARVALDWFGRNKKDEADGAAVAAMRAALNGLGVNGRVVIGEGEKDKAPLLYRGERIGDPSAPPDIDIAVDPIEGTTNLSLGVDNSTAVIAVTPAGAMTDLGNAFYMDKFVAPPPAAKAGIDSAWPVDRKLKAVAGALGKPVSGLRAFVLDRPRHKDLIAEVYKTGASCVRYPHGDVAGALMALTGSGVDVLLGAGGAPEGVISAVAVKALGGVFHGRLAPQSPDEEKKIREQGQDPTRWYSADELVKSDKIYFCCSAISNGPLGRGIERSAAHDRVQSLMICGQTKTRHLVSSWLPR
jgi:fructose-1,6-bisphosphatase II